jgi:hypothetical protein
MQSVFLTTKLPESRRHGDNNPPLWAAGQAEKRDRLAIVRFSRGVVVDLQSRFYFDFIRSGERKKGSQALKERR